MSDTFVDINKKNKAGKTMGVFLFLYIALLLASFVYIWVFTQDRYETVAEIRISKQETSGVDASLLNVALPGLTDSRSQDSQLTISFINSSDFLIGLEKEFPLQKHYSSPKTDVVYRLPKDANRDERLEFYRSRISAHYNKESGLTEIKVDTFDPELSKKVADYLLAQSETFINQVNQEIADRQYDFHNREVDRAAANLSAVNQELTELQNKYKFVSPSVMITSSLEIIQQLRVDVLRAKAELQSLMRDSPDSPRIDTIESNIKSLESLIVKEGQKLSGEEKDRMNVVLLEFTEVEQKIEFRQRLLSGAELVLENNRSDAISKSRFFTVIQHPYTPEGPTYPKRLYATATILILGSILLVILRILLQSVLERS